jgi:hypothetical protein
VQATSYWLTDFAFFEFWGCSPAYFVPATPPSANAEPGEDDAWPGRVPVVSQLWFG